MPDQIARNKGGRPKGSKNRPHIPETTVECLEDLMRDVYVKAKTAGNDREMREWIRLYAYCEQVRTLREARMNLDATVGLKAALEEFYGVKGGESHDGSS